MGRATSKGNEAKSKIKHSSDMPMLRFELWSNALPIKQRGRMKINTKLLGMIVMTDQSTH